MKSFTFCIFLALLLTFVCLASAQVPCNPTLLQNPTLFVNWPQFRYDAGHTGCNPYEHILSPSTVGGLVLDWKYLAGTQVKGDPVVANGLVYFTSEYPEDTLYAVNAVTGALVWKYAAGQTILSDPVVVNGVVYLGAFPQALSGFVYAFNAATGEMLWQYTTQNQIESAPTVANGVVYVGDASGYLYALNASTGTFLWDYQLPGYDIVAAPAVANGVIYFAASEPEFPQKCILSALDATTHQVIWQYMWNYAIGDTPVVASGVVYFNSTALDAKSGALRWTSGVHFFGLPAVARGVVYVGSDDDKVYALNASTGNILWSYRTGSFVNDSPAVANGVVYVGSADGSYYAFNADNGTLLWQYGPLSTYNAGAAVANGLVYINSQDNNLYAFHLPGH